MGTRRTKMGQACVWVVGIVALMCLQCVSSFKLVCYFTNWSQYRLSSGRFVTDHIDPHLCTHIIYAFASIEDNKLVPTEWNDATTYGNLNNLKRRNPSLKILLSVGGFNAGSKIFRNLTTNVNIGSDFVLSVMQFLRRNNFDGFELAWHSSEDYKRHLAMLVQDLSTHFKKEAKKSKKEKLILTVAVPAGREAIDRSYDIRIISAHADFLTFLSFDFHGSWELYTGHLSPLQKGNADTGSASSYNVDYAVKFLLGKGASPQKIIMGIPTFGRSFTLSSAQTIIGAPASGGGTPGPFTNETGILAHYEICSFNAGATIERSEEQKVPYSHKGNQWVGYEDETSVQQKVEYMKSHNLGGILIWTLDLDDFSGSFCNQGKYPLVAAAKQKLNEGLVV